VAAEVMTALASHDAQVVVEGDRVRLLFSAGHRPPEALVEAARFHKQAPRAILENRQETSPSGLYGHLLAALRSKRPHLVEPDRWQQATRDPDSFLTTSGQKAEALGWTARELFGLHPPAGAFNAVVQPAIALRRDRTDLAPTGPSGHRSDGNDGGHPGGYWRHRLS
jgi:hypothetical protein